MLRCDDNGLWYGGYESCGGTKGAYMHVSIPTLKLVMELRKSV